MKQICKDYFNEIKELLKNKAYTISIILITLLSYGFTLTHFSVGVDDLCFDRYVTGTYIISAGRWGTALLYNLLGITTFSPFWLDLIVTLLTIILGLIFTVFIKRNFSKNLKTIHYTIITTLIISYPILNLSFIYQSTNLSVILGNLYLMIIPIIIYELFKKNDKVDIPTIIFLGLTLPFFISMYESCCQSFVCMTFIAAFIYVHNSPKETRKKIIKYIFISIIVLIIGLIINTIMCKIINHVLENSGRLTYNYAYKLIPWKYPQNDMKKIFTNNFLLLLFNNIQNTPYVRNFFILFIITFILSIINSFKNKNIYLVPILLVILVSCFIINILQAYLILRINTCWIIAIAFFTTYLLSNINKETLNLIISAILIIMIFYHTRTMNQLFYNDYTRYEKEANYAYSIAYEIIKTCTDTSKPIVYHYTELNGIHQSQINEVNGKSVFNWGAYGFEIPGMEITKFINSLGFNFNIGNKELFDKVQTDIKNNNIIIEKNKQIYETDNYILVLFNINI